MKLAYCQYDVKNGDINANLKTVKRLLKNLDADIVVLPELAFTGYAFASKEALRPYTIPAIQTRIIEEMTSIARQYNLVIVAGMAETEQNHLYNSAFIIDKTGLVGKHHKINLTDNEQMFTPGDSLEVYDVKGIKLGVTICFDTWFPEAFRKLADKGAELICAPSNFGGPWTIDVVKVRALENAIPVVMCNRIGLEIIAGEPAEFCGHSEIIDHQGNILIQAQDEETVGVVAIEPKDADRNTSLICKNMLLERSRYNQLK